MAGRFLEVILSILHQRCSICNRRAHKKPPRPRGAGGFLLSFVLSMGVRRRRRSLFLDRLSLQRGCRGRPGCCGRALSSVNALLARCELSMQGVIEVSRGACLATGWRWTGAQKNGCAGMPVARFRALDIITAALILFQLSAFSFQLSAFSFQLSAFSFQLSAFSFQRKL